MSPGDEVMRELLCFRSDLADLTGEWEKLKGRIERSIHAPEITEVEKRLKRLDVETRQGYNQLDEKLG